MANGKSGLPPFGYWVAGAGIGIVIYMIVPHYSAPRSPPAATAPAVAPASQQAAAPEPVPPTPAAPAPPADDAARVYAASVFKSLSSCTDAFKTMSDIMGKSTPGDYRVAADFAHERCSESGDRILKGENPPEIATTDSQSKHKNLDLLKLKGICGAAVYLEDNAARTNLSAANDIAQTGHMSVDDANA